MTPPPPTSTLFPYTTLFRSYGDVPTQRCEVWTVTSTGVNDVVDMSKFAEFQVGFGVTAPPVQNAEADRKSTRLNSSHSSISYAVFCLKKKKQNMLEMENILS